MLKLFPLIIITSLFFIIFFNVKFLTSKIEKESINNPIVEEGSNQEIIDDNLTNKDLSNRTNKEIDNIANLNIEKKVEKSDLKIQGRDSVSYTEKKGDKISKTKDNNNSQIKLEKKELTKNLIIDNGDIIKSQTKSIDKLIKIQFGAFSNMKNAEKQKDLIFNILSSKKDGFTNKLEISKENKLYKILYYSETIKNAKSICDFARSKKLGCLILKK